MTRRIGRAPCLVLLAVGFVGCLLSGFDNVDSVSRCEPGTTAPCYSGPPGSEGVGDCKHGVQTCNADGSDYGPCVGEVLPKLEVCATAGDEDCDGVACSDPVWGTRFGADADQIAQSLAIDGDGNVLVGGVFLTTIDLGGGPLTAPPGEAGLFLGKLDPFGKHLWSRMIGHGAPYGDCTSSCQLGSVTVTVGPLNRVVIAGSFTGTVDLGDGDPHTNADTVPDIFVGEVASQTGLGKWSKAYGSVGGDAYAFALATDASGALLTTGFYRGTIDFGSGPMNSAGPTDAFVLKFDQSGNVVWTKALGVSTADEIGLGIATDPSGGFALVGYFDNTTTFGGAMLASAGNADLFIARFDGSGNHLWSESFGGAGNDYAVKVAIDPSGNLAIVGHSDDSLSLGGGVLPAASPGELDGIVAKYSADGSPLWSRRFGDAARQTLSGVAVDRSGDVIIGGGAFGSIDFGGGPLTGGGEVAVVAKFDAAGKHLWSRGLDPANPTMADQGAFNAIAVDSSGNVVGAGAFQGRVKVGDAVLVGAGGWDSFVAKFMP